MKLFNISRYRIWQAMTQMYTSISKPYTSHRWCQMHVSSGFYVIRLVNSPGIKANKFITELIIHAKNKYFPSWHMHWFSLTYCVYVACCCFQIFHLSYDILSTVTIFSLVSVYTTWQDGHGYPSLLEYNVYYAAK